jgi:hypothetical protein
MAYVEFCNVDDNLNIIANEFYGTCDYNYETKVYELDNDLKHIC